MRFSAPIQTCPRVNKSGRGVENTHTASAEVKERVQLYFYSHSGPSWPVLGTTSFLSLPLVQSQDGQFMNHVRNNYLKHLSTFAEVQSTRVGTLIVATIYLQLIQNRYMFRSITVLQAEVSATS